MRKSWFLVLLTLLGVLLLSAACGDDDDDGGDGSPTSAATTAAADAGTATDDGAEPANEEVVKIGLITSLSGRFGNFGAPFRDGAAFAVEQINEDGGFVIDDTRYTFELIVVDDRSEQDAAVQGATQLIADEGVVAIFGPIGPLGPSVAEITKTEGVLNFSSSSSVAAIAGPPDYPLVFTTIASAAKRVEATVDGINEFVPDAQTVGILGPDDETAAAIVPQLESALEGKTVTSYLYPTGTTDLSTVLTRLAGDDPDVIILGWATTDRQTQGSQFAAAGVPADTPLFLYADSIGICNEIAGGRPCIAHPLAGADLTSSSLTPERQQFIDDFLAFTNATELPGASAAILWTYDWPFMVAQAMEQAETVEDAEAIADELRGGGVTRDDGLIGTITYDDTNKAVHGFDVSLVDADGTITTEHFE